MKIQVQFTIGNLIIKHCLITSDKLPTLEILDERFRLPWKKNIHLIVRDIHIQIDDELFIAIIKKYQLVLFWLSKISSSSVK